MVLEILEHEKKKNPAQSVEGTKKGKDNTSDKLINPASRAGAVRDTYNELYGLMEASKLKGGFTENISAKNMEVSQEKLSLKDIYLMPYFVTKVLKIDAPDGLRNGQQIFEYYEQHPEALAEAMGISDENFGGQNLPREDDNILVRLEENGRQTIYDGNGRSIRKILKLVLEGESIDGATINAWVLKGDGQPLQDFWVPTSKLADLMKMALENAELKESAKQLLRYYFDQSPKCVNLELDRAAEMSEFKTGAESVHDFVEELRKEWNILKV